MNCLYCKAPIGGYQIMAYFHKACRRLGRIRYGQAPYWHEKIVYRAPATTEADIKETPMVHDIPTRPQPKLSLWQRIIKWIKKLGQ